MIWRGLLLALPLWALAGVAQEVPDLRQLDPAGRRQALGRLLRSGGDTAVLQLLPLLEERLAPETQALLGHVLCRLGATVGVDLLFAVAFRPPGPGVERAYRALRDVLAPELPLAEAGTTDRTALYALKRRWDREGSRSWLRGAPKTPSRALRAGVREWLAALLRADPDEAFRWTERISWLRDLAAAEVLRAQAQASAPGRDRCRKALVLMGRHALPALEQALRGGPTPARRAALEVLAWLPAQTRNDPGLGARLAALAPLLAQALGEEQRVAEWPLVLGALAWTGGPKEARSVRLLLTRRDLPPALRLASVRTLGRLGAPEDAPRLLALARSPEHSLALRMEAALGAVLLGDPRGVGVLVTLLKATPLPLPWLRRIAGGAYFGYERDREAGLRRWQAWWHHFGSVLPLPLQALREAQLVALENRVFAEEIQRNWLAPCRSHRSWTARLDGEARLRAAAPRLMPTLERVLAAEPDPWLRFHAAQALAVRELRAGVPALVQALSDPVPPIRGVAAVALGRIGRAFGYAPMAEALADALRPLLQDPDPWVRHGAALGLAHLGFPDGIPILIQSLESPEPSVADHAWILLRRVTGGRDEGFQPGAPQAARARAVAALRRWWAAQGRTFRPEPPR